MSAGGTANGAEMTHLQRIARLLPPLCNLCIAAAVIAVVSLQLLVISSMQVSLKTVL